MLVSWFCIISFLYARLCFGPICVRMLCVYVRTLIVCMRIQLGCVRMPYVCACTPVPRNAHCFLLVFLCFLLLVKPLFDLIFHIFEYLPLCFVCFFFLFFLMLIRVLDCLNAMNMHMDMNMHWCIGVMMQWGKSCINHMNIYLNVWLLNFLICLFENHESWRLDV